MSAISYPSVHGVSTPPKTGMVRRFGSALLWLLAGLLLIGLAIPVPLLFLITAVPVLLSCILVAIDVGFWEPGKVVDVLVNRVLVETPPVRCSENRATHVSKWPHANARRLCFHDYGCVYS